MAVLRISSIQWLGLSTDTKPTSAVPTNSSFLETDTRSLYYYDGVRWNRTRVHLGSSGRKWGVWSGLGDTIAADGLLAINLNVPASQTTAALIDTTIGRGRKFTTSTTITTNAGWRQTATFTTRALNPAYRALFRLGTTTLQRLYLGFHTSGVDLTGDDPLNAQAGVMLGMRSADTNFQILHNDTSGATVFDIDTGVAVDTAIHRIEIIADDANSRFGWSLDGSAFSFTNLTADIPPQTTNLLIQNEIQTNEASVAKILDLALVEVEMDSKWP